MTKGITKGATGPTRGETRVRAVLSGYTRYRVVKVIHTDDDQYVVEAYHTKNSKSPLRAAVFARIDDARAQFTRWCFAR